MTTYVNPGWRGTYGGLCSPAMIEHLKKLGVTTIELLPVHGLIDDRVLVEEHIDAVARSKRQRLAEDLGGAADRQRPLAADDGVFGGGRRGA